MRMRWWSIGPAALCALAIAACGGGSSGRTDAAGDGDAAVTEAVDAVATEEVEDGASPGDATTADRKSVV